MHEALQKSPFKLIYGTKPIALPEASEKTNSPVANDCISQLYKSCEEALAAHKLAQIKMKERITHHSKPFKVNDELTPKWEGPFMIKEVLGPVTY
ncbi:hypothetical protein AX14_009906 [Amanita brunnescens Koide BX004]|nr:hypothetical protein AX14_009906 [Amanita brunnescens Koide BX004]